MDEYIVEFHKDERGIARDWTERGKLTRCKDCMYQLKDWHADRRFKKGGYFIFGCEKGNYLGSDNQYCSKGIKPRRERDDTNK